LSNRYNLILQSNLHYHHYYPDYCYIITVDKVATAIAGAITIILVLLVLITKLTVTRLLLLI
jgi:hypothetical protein